MNFLAHAYLSFNHPEILTGNIISDFVKGKKQFDYPLMVQKGIQLHREIDTYTDEHPVTKKLKYYFKQHYRLYSGAFIDIIYDHFLANDLIYFKSERELLSFAQQVYTVLQDNYINLPAKFQQMFPYMVQQNWLYNYRHKDGIKQSFNGLVRRSVYLTESNTAFTLFDKNYQEIKEGYTIFFPQVKTFALKKFKELLTN